MSPHACFGRTSLLRVVALAALAGCNANASCTEWYLPQITFTADDPAPPKTTSAYAAVGPRGTNATPSISASARDDLADDDSRASTSSGSESSSSASAGRDDSNAPTDPANSVTSNRSGQAPAPGENANNSESTDGDGNAASGEPPPPAENIVVVPVPYYGGYNSIGRGASREAEAVAANGQVNGNAPYGNAANGNQAYSNPANSYQAAATQAGNAAYGTAASAGAQGAQVAQGSNTNAPYPTPAGAVDNTHGITNPPEIARPIYYPTPAGANNQRVVVTNPPTVGTPVNYGVVVPRGAH